MFGVGIPIRTGGGEGGNSGSIRLLGPASKHWAAGKIDQPVICISDVPILMMARAGRNNNTAICAWMTEQLRLLYIGFK
jgi:hypothetical protein